VTTSLLLVGAENYHRWPRDGTSMWSRLPVCACIWTWNFRRARPQHDGCSHSPARYKRNTPSELGFCGARWNRTIGLTTRRCAPRARGNARFEITKPIDDTEEIAIMVTEHCRLVTNEGDCHGGELPGDRQTARAVIVVGIAEVIDPATFAVCERCRPTRGRCDRAAATFGEGHAQEWRTHKRVNPLATVGCSLCSDSVLSAGTPPRPAACDRGQRDG
jgi:hypothetical protein